MKQIDNNEKLAIFAEEINDWLESNKQITVRITEAISSNNLNYDRHFTSTNQFALTIQHVAFRISGAIFTIYGTKNDQYEINAYAIFLGEIESDSVTVIEKLAGKYTRRSTINVIQG